MLDTDVIAKQKYLKELGPPNDICIQHEEWHTYMVGGTSQCRFGNAYYHASIAYYHAKFAYYIEMYCLLLVVTTGNYIILKLGSKVVPVVHSSPLITDSLLKMRNINCEASVL